MPWPVIDSSPTGPADSSATPEALPASARPSPGARSRLGDRARSELRAEYLEIDRRQLALFRIYFGLVLLVDILRRFPYLTLFYSNDGVLPNHYAIFAPMAQPTFSLFFACSTTGEVAIAFTLTALVYVGLVVGYRTKLMQILTAILYPSLISRNLFFEMGGSCCLTLVASWTVFLPLGDRFSIDALTNSLARRRERKASALNDREALRPDRSPHASIVTLGLLLQVTAIYFFNCVQKYGEDWKSGDAVHWVLWQNRIATTLCGWLRMHEPRWFSPFLSWGTLVTEALAPLMLLTPFLWRYSRAIYVVLALSLHAGIALFVDVGPYSYIMFAFDFLMIPAIWFDRGAAWLSEGKIARTVVYDPTDPGLHWLARVLARLDSFELLTFVDRGELEARADLAGAPTGGWAIATRRPDGTWRVGADAVLDALQALPLGRAFALLPIGAPIRAFLDERSFLAGLCRWSPGDPESRAGPVAIELRARKLLPRWLEVWARELTALLFAFVTMMQIFHDNWWLGDKFPRWLREGPPGPLADVPIYLRQLQGWMMFREAPRTDGTLIVDALTESGRHVDPFTGKPPDYDVYLHGPLLYGQLFCDYFNHITDSGNAHYRRFFANYLTHWQELEGRPPGDRIRSFKVIWVGSDSPRWGQTRPTKVWRDVILEGP
jgi:hypothetical protein